MKLEEIAEEIIEEYFYFVSEGHDPWGSYHFFASAIEACQDYQIKGARNLKKLERLLNKFLRKYNRDWMFRINISEKDP